MKTKYEVTYRIRRLTKSGRVTRSKSRAFRIKTRRFDTRKEAEAFAKITPDPMGPSKYWPKIEEIQIDDTLLLDIFSIPRGKQ